MRIASLVPSATDILCRLGLADRLVGVSHECDHPAAKGLPVLTRANVPAAPDAPPGEVDAAVTATVAAGESLYVADRARLAELAPDLVISQDICDVCAVEGTEARRALPAGSRLVMLSAVSLDGLEDDLRRVGEATDAIDAAAEAIDALRAARQRAPTGEGARVLLLEWGDPPFLAGHWVPELIEAVGAVSALGRPGDPSRRATWEEVAASKPDAVVYAPCGYTLAQAEAEAATIVPLKTLGAPVHVADATRWFSRCTPDAVLGALDFLEGVVGRREDSD
jgi:iron complex transport system substrate-binding protein